VNTSAARAAKKATAAIPIVITRVADPVKSGLVASMSRPGGNITGLSFLPEALSAKQLQLLKEALPRVSRVAAMWYVITVKGMEAASVGDSRRTRHTCRSQRATLRNDQSPLIMPAYSGGGVGCRIACLRE
jgi:ABC transporter substrate binding protein